MLYALSRTLTPTITLNRETKFLTCLYQTTSFIYKLNTMFPVSSPFTVTIFGITTRDVYANEILELVGHES